MSRKKNYQKFYRSSVSFPNYNRKISNENKKKFFFSFNISTKNKIVEVLNFIDQNLMSVTSAILIDPTFKLFNFANFAIKSYLLANHFKLLPVTITFKLVTPSKVNSTILDLFLDSSGLIQSQARYVPYKLCQSVSRINN